MYRPVSCLKTCVAFVLLVSLSGACSSASLTATPEPTATKPTATDIPATHTTAPEPTVTLEPAATEIPATHTAAPPETELEPQTPEQTFTPQQLQEDLQVLHTTLQQAHPGLYLYTDQATRDAQFNELFAQLDHEMTELEFLRLIGPFITAIHDGHTAMWPCSEFVDTYYSQNVFCPFTLRFIEGRAYVDLVLAPEAEISRGTEVLEINGLPMSTMLNLLLQFVPHDGHGETLKYARLGQGFPRFLMFVLQPSAVYEVKARRPMSGEEETVQLAAINLRAATAMVNQELRTRELLSLEILEDEGIAIMTISSFEDRGIPAFLKSSFETLNDLEIQDLVIDLRGNEGGDDSYGAMLFSYLTDKEFRYYDHLETVIDEPLTYLEYTDWSESAQDAYLRSIESLERTASGAVIFPHAAGLHNLQNYRRDNFEGDVYFLIDGGSFSATGEFASVAHHNQRGVFIGEETGATYYGNNSGGMLLLTLPNTRVRVVIPRFRYVIAVSGYPYSDRGLVPDYLITQSVEDFIGGVDTHKEFTLDMIRQNQ